PEKTIEIHLRRKRKMPRMSLRKMIEVIRVCGRELAPEKTIEIHLRRKRKMPRMSLRKMIESIALCGAQME
ncbi:MAG: hypothetical protein IKU12_05860, partial [Oscillospiraceae bacterium]|nr:hypothetical protein [Oscillospiraceae bacterium]